jgi:hypothetical protein
MIPLDRKLQVVPMKDVLDLVWTVWCTVDRVYLLLPT